jgi:ParB-like chromosome segregation protein Spo0J
MREAHPFAALVPPMTAAESAALSASIRDIGYIGAPIMLHRDGRILDGRHREQAGAEADIAVPAQTFTGTDDEALEHVIALNVRRRHLNESQRAMVAAKLANITRTDTLKHGARPATLPIGKVSQPAAARMLSVSDRLVRHAKIVCEKAAPTLVQRVERGEIAVSVAAKLVGLPPSEQDRVAAARDAAHRNSPQFFPAGSLSSHNSSTLMVG